MTTSGGSRADLTYTRLRLYDDQGNLLASQPTNGAGGLVMLNEYLSAGIYRILVSESPSKNGVPYRLLVNYP